MLNLVFAALGLGHMAAAYRGPKWFFYLSKPGAMLVLVVMALGLGATDSPYGRWLLAGLLLSTLGDILLMLPKDRFVAGLVAFLLAHLCYVAAFWPQELGLHWPWLLALLVVAALVLRLLWPGLGAFKGPVLGYMAAILLMAWLAGERYLAAPGSGTALAALGALVFMLSDSVLALDRFHRPFKAASAVIMGTYYGAQYLLVLSLT